MRLILQAVIPLVFVSACGAELPDPRPLSITPESAYNGEDTVVFIEGSAFYPLVEVDARTAGEADVNAGFRVRLMTGTETVGELVGTGLVDFEHLQGVVPAGLPTGLYAVEVQGPTGRIGRLDSAFRVTDTRADRLDVDVGSLVYEVFDTAWIEVQLVDPNDQRVLSDLPITVDVLGEDGPLSVSFEQTGFEDMVVNDDGTSVSGRIGTDGRARIGVSVSTPGTTLIAVSPQSIDSNVADGEVRVLWEPGSELSLDIVLPDSPFTATAGEPFTAQLALYDQFGNPVFDASEVVLLKNACETWVDAVTVSGVTPIRVTLREATGTSACRTDNLLSVSGPDGASLPLTVRPGAVDRFDVVVNPGSVVAGQGLLNVFVTPVDRFGNLTGGTGGTLSLTQSTNETLTPSCVGTTPIFCTAQPVVAGQDIVLTVDDGAGTTGTSNPHTVRPAAAVSLTAVFTSQTVVAGQDAQLLIDARDPYENAVILDAQADVDVVASAETPVCTPNGVGASGATQLSCVFTEAATARTVEVTVDDLTATSTVVDVVNGPLASVTLSPAQRTVAAGEPVTVTATGRDAFGNLYVVQSDAELALSDTSGSFSADAVVLGGTGSATVSGTLTVAGDAVIIASQGGQELGRSIPVRVVAGPAEALDIVPSEPWAFTGEGLDIMVRAVDEYGNVADVDRAATLTSETSAFEPVQVALVDGLGLATVLWSAPVDETLSATASGLLDAERPLVVVADCGEGGPSAALAINGAATGIVCADDHERAVATVSVAHSGTAGSPLVTGLVTVNGQVVSALSATTVDLQGYGRTVLRGLVADATGCGDEISGDVWLGPDDGSVTGPIAVTASSAFVAAGTGTSVMTLDDVRDCNGDLATGAELFIRTNRGELTGVQSTGAGLVLTLDGAGDASATLDVTGDETGGGATVVVRTATGSAAGVRPVVVTGDLRHPRVVRVEPAGLVAQPVSSVQITFSEPLLATSVVPASFRVDGPADVAVAAAVLSAAGRVVTVSLDPALDPADGTFSLVVTRDVRDVAGNRLDGTYTAESFDFVTPIGAVPAPGVGPTGCAVDTFRFRPDGDDGDGIEADGVTLSWTGDDTPLWWVLDVVARTGERVRTDIIPASASDEQWWWSGRDDSGRIVNDGTYTVSVDARDEHGNRITGCDAAVTIDNEARRER